MNIRYNHTSPETAENLESALALVETQAIQQRGSAQAFRDHVTFSAADGLYIWLSQDEMDRDSDGSRAFAVIDNGSHGE